MNFTPGVFHWQDLSSSESLGAVDLPAVSSAAGFHHRLQPADPAGRPGGSLSGLGLEDLPQLASTRISVSARFPAASPEVVEQSVTAVLEQQLHGLDGLESISSSSRQEGPASVFGSAAVIPN